MRIQRHAKRLSSPITAQISHKFPIKIRMATGQNVLTSIKKSFSPANAVRRMTEASVKKREKLHPKYDLSQSRFRH